MHDWKFSPIVAGLNLPKRATSSRAVRRDFILKDDLRRITGDPIAQEKLFDPFDASTTIEPPTWRTIVPATKEWIPFDALLVNEILIVKFSQLAVAAPGGARDVQDIPETWRHYSMSTLLFAKLSDRPQNDLSEPWSDRVFDSVRGSRIC
jgi:hypothetical protein